MKYKLLNHKANGTDPSEEASMSRNETRYALIDRRELVTVGAAIAALVPLSGSAFAPADTLTPPKERHG